MLLGMFSCHLVPEIRYNSMQRIIDICQKRAHQAKKDMSYQVLARKWRPRGFAEMVGQEHVLRALSNALDSGRLHHAFLFTGTRGVGKTTIARILAKSLNCEQGMSASPCGNCATCQEIDEGRFVDLIEVDAASRTKVEDTRELLDNVQYAPTRGRYKVYLIDEVHMLSGHSFNALLKTLEEPPPHVKFLLATTDPQKLPITILSRCLQFNLRRLSLERIERHLQMILQKEGVAFDDSALLQLARAADGSMRDALSLLDQAIAFGNGEVREADVRAMLGTIEQHHVYDLLDALAARDGVALIQRVHALAQQAPDFAAVLAELITTLHYLALLQQVPQAWDASMGDKQRFDALLSQLSAEDIQLYYQIALTGRRDLPLAPDQRNGLEMVLLRMLAFSPASAAPTVAASSVPAAPAPSVPQQQRQSATVATAATVDVAKAEPVTSTGTRISLSTLGTDNWHEVVAGLSCEGVLKQLVEHCAFSGLQDNTLSLALAPAHAIMANAEREKQLQQKLQQYFQQDITLRIEQTQQQTETPAARSDRQQQERLAEAQQSIVNDANVKNIIETFNAEVDLNSVQALDTEQT